MTLFDVPEPSTPRIYEPPPGPRRRRTVIDRTEATVVTEEAVDRNASNTPERWRTVLVDAARRVALRLDEFTVDDVWVEVGYIPTGKGPASALGPAMREVAKHGWAVRTDRTRDSARPEAHRKPQRVWVSRLR